MSSIDDAEGIDDLQEPPARPVVTVDHHAEPTLLSPLMLPAEQPAPMISDRDGAITLLCACLILGCIVIIAAAGHELAEFHGWSW